MRISNKMWMSLAAAGLMFVGAVAAFAKGEVTQTGYEDLDEGTITGFIATASCPDNSPTQTIQLSVVITDQNGNFVAGGSAQGTGTSVGVSVAFTCPAAGTTLKATTVLTQASGPGDTAKTNGVSHT